jgi:hypothetical protein
VAAKTPFLAATVFVLVNSVSNFKRLREAFFVKIGILDFLQVTA